MPMDIMTTIIHHIPNVYPPSTMNAILKYIIVVSVLKLTEKRFGCCLYINRLHFSHNVTLLCDSDAKINAMQDGSLCCQPHQDRVTLHFYIKYLYLSTDTKLKDADMIIILYILHIDICSPVGELRSEFAFMSAWKNDARPGMKISFASKQCSR